MADDCLLFSPNDRDNYYNVDYIVTALYCTAVVIVSR